MTMQVEPERLLDLIQRYKDVHKSIQSFLHGQGDALRARPLADDEVSGDAAAVFTAHSTLALGVTEKFLVALNVNIEQLLAAARTYGLVEDDNADVMRGLHEGAGR